MEKTNKQIAIYTGISTGTQAQLCFDSAWCWLSQVLPDEPNEAEFLFKHPQFWSWWTRNWEVMDKAFLDCLECDIKGYFSIYIPGSCIRTIVRSTNHLGIIWEDWHHVRYVATNKDLIIKSYINLNKVKL